MARRIVAAFLMAALGAPLVARFAAGDTTRLCTTHVCPHHAVPASGAAKPCHHAAAVNSCELKCGCQTQEAIRLVSTPPFLATPAEELTVFVEPSAATSVTAAAPRAGHLRLEPHPPRAVTFTS
jgi:hypothetical protein